MEGEVNMKRWGWRLVCWGSTKKDAPYLLRLRRRHQHSNQRFNSIRAPCVASITVGTNGEEDQMARLLA